MDRDREQLIQDFHDLYYKSNVWGGGVSWLGRVILKCPMDLWRMQSIIRVTKPTVLIECGTGGGGATRYFAHIFDLLDNGRVISIDNREDPGRPSHPRITYLHGSSVSEEVVAAVKELIRPDDRVMVDLDSAHSRQHVAAELEIYSQLVTPGGALIVEDTNVSGPRRATEAFLKVHTDFHRMSELKTYLTFNPGGYLIRRKS